MPQTREGSDKVDSVEATLLGLTEAVSGNSEQIDARAKAISQNSDRINALTGIVTENRDLILMNQRQILELHEKVDRLMKHLDVPPKPPAGFLKK